MQLIVNTISVPVGTQETEVFEIAEKRIRPLWMDTRILELIEKASVYRRSVDARKKNDIKFVYSVLFEINTTVIPSEEKLKAANSALYSPVLPQPVPGDRIMSQRPVIVGFGPCGMFCALMLAEYGYKPIVVERGSSVFERMKKVEKFSFTRELDENSNIQFGAGGAGTFSDGKLVTRINDGKCRYVLSKFCEFGAPEEVMTEAKPHVGTDMLRNIVSNLGEKIEELGGTILYDTKLEEIEQSGGYAKGITTQNGDIPCGVLVLAIGHSARDTYKLLKNNGFTVAPKPFSVGVRIEHLAKDIDYALYGKSAGDKRLGHAEYALSAHFDGIGVYTFCMCPGGEVVAAASENGGVVVNGMSNYARNGRNSNSAIAVSVAPENPIEFQRELEHYAYEAGGGNFSAPVQTVGDFVSGKIGTEPSRVQPSYMGGGHDAYRICDLNKVLPEKVCGMLKSGLCDFDRKIKGFAVPDAVLTGVETRTSAPVRILRNDAYIADNFENIYPCGEGAGYAGGITSAAVDGINCAMKIIEKYKPFEG